VAVLLPVLNRAHRVEPLLASLRASECGVPLEPLFLASRGDRGELAALKSAGVRYEIVGQASDSHQYPRKMNHGYRLACDEGHAWSFTGADDLAFEPGWADEAVAVAAATGACVIGTDDRANARVRAGKHSTHTLFSAEYRECGTVDEDDKLFHEGYHHWWADDECIQTAMFRGTFAFARHAVVRHLHPIYGGAEDDETYRRGQATVAEDKATYDARCWMWRR
jgi:hypothetical protein